jgi:hypothetical protein
MALLFKRGVEIGVEVTFDSAGMTFSEGGTTTQIESMLEVL